LTSQALDFVLLSWIGDRLFDSAFIVLTFVIIYVIVIFLIVL
jgi:hypothetical protein